MSRERCWEKKKKSVLSAPRASDPTVIGSVLRLPRQSEERGEGGDRYVEEQLPRIPQAEQVEVA